MSVNPLFGTCVRAVGCVSFVAQALVTATPIDGRSCKLPKVGADYERGLLTGRTML